MPRTAAKPQDADSRHARILDEAIMLIGERGYYGFTIGELARRSGLSNPGLLHYFPSKRQVVLGVLDELERRETDIMLPLIEAISPVGDEPPSKTAVLTILRAFSGRGRAEPKISRLIVKLKAESLEPDHPAHEWWKARDARLLEMLTALIGPHVADPAATALQLVSMMTGLAAEWHRMGNFDLREQWELALRKLLPELM